MITKSITKLSQNLYLISQHISLSIQRRIKWLCNVLAKPLLDSTRPNSSMATSYQRMSIGEVRKEDSSISDLNMDLDKWSTTSGSASTSMICTKGSGCANPTTPPTFSSTSIYRYPSIIFWHLGPSIRRCPQHLSIYLRQPISPLNKKAQLYFVTSI